MTVQIEKLLRMGEQISANMAYTDDSEIVVNHLKGIINQGTGS